MRNAVPFISGQQDPPSANHAGPGDDTLTVFPCMYR